MTLKFLFKSSKRYFDVRGGTILFLLLSFYFFLQGCVVQVEGESSAKMKEKLQASYLYKSTNRFYPEHKVPTNPAAIEESISAKFIGDTQRELAGLLDSLSKLHHAKYEQIHQHLPVMPEATKTRITVKDNADFPNAKSGADGTITVNARVLQSVYRGAVLEMYRSSKNSRRSTWFDNPPDAEFDETFDPSNATEAQRAAIQQSIDWVEEIDQIDGRSMLGEIVDMMKDDALEGPWFKAADLQMSSSALQTRYLGAVLFVLAHEQGHLALNHFKHHADILQRESQTGTFDCAARRKLEEEADIYALLLLSPNTENAPGNLLAASLFPELNSIAGYRNFLSYGYPLSGFTESSGETCKYDSNKVRYERLAALESILSDANTERVNEAFSQAIEEAAKTQEREQ